MPRYVVLHHTGFGEPHFDLMLDPDGVGPLLTWRLDAWPVPKRITPLPAHRRIYLDYQGPVSNNRGAVRRIASGSYERLDDSPGALRVRLDVGELELPTG